MSQQADLIGRRDALCTLAGLAAAAAGLAVIGVGTTAAFEGGEPGEGPSVRADEIESVDPAELARVEALIPSTLAGAWTVDRVFAPRLGAVAVVMRTPAGNPFQVDVLRREAGVQGVAETSHFSLFIANDGDGQTATDEMEARGAKVLAHEIRRREQAGMPAPTLLSHGQRAAEFPLGEFRVLG